MSDENVALVRRIYAAWDREAPARDFISDDVVYVNLSYAVEPGVRRGRASFRAIRFRWFQSHREALEAAGVDESEGA